MPAGKNIRIPDGPIFRAGRKIVQTLRRAGYDAYWVGGAVRDLVLGDSPDDIDIVSTAHPEAAAELFPGSDAVGACFGVMLVKQDGLVFELATAREERGYTDGRRPDQVRYTTDLELDLQRRDFTINAMLCDPETGEVTDYHGGLADLAAHSVRTVGNAEVRFREDYLRMLRAVRFAARLGFQLEPATLAAIRKIAGKSALLAPERVREELDKMLTDVSAPEALRLLRSTGLLAAVLPEVEALAGVTQNPQYHPEGDVWEHTLKMFDLANKPLSRNLAWSLLLHDTGKPETWELDGKNVPHFYAHEAVGEKIAIQCMERLRFSNEDREIVAHAVRNHMRFASVQQMRPATLRRLLAEPQFDLELELHRLDCMGSHNLLGGYEFLLKARDRAAEQGKLQLPPPLVTGNDLLKKGYIPGPRFKTILEAAMDEQLSGNVTTPDAAMQWIETHFPMRGTAVNA